ncbi:MAG: hypothetical protein ACR5KV_02410 [Wolbachia sp.]
MFLMRNAFSTLIKSFKDNNNGNKHFLMRIAAWLINNTTLTFNQIAQCCGLTPKEAQTMADEEIEVEEYNPIISGIVTEKEIDDSEKNPNHIPKLIVKV